MNAQLLSSIAALLDETVYTVNPRPINTYIDATGAPLSSDHEYTALGETVIPVWNFYGLIYLVNMKQESNFVFTPKQFTLQFRKDPLVLVQK